MPETLPPDVWILVPARAGSKAIPRKNLRRLAGKPLVLHALEAAGEAAGAERVVVSTDDREVMDLAAGRAVVHERAAGLAGDRATLDDVAVAVCEWLLARGASRDDLLLTVQPTSPFLEPATIVEAAERLRGGAGSVITVTDDRHLRWTVGDDGAPRPLFEARVNRQWLPPAFAETGGIIGARVGDVLDRGTRVVEPVALVELDAREGLDIDTPADWAVAEHYARRRRVVIRADAAPDLGVGHAYRAIALANELSDHDLRIITRGDGDYALGVELLERSPHRVEAVAGEEEFLERLEALRPHLVILDVLDTEADYVGLVKSTGAFVASFEDQGPGALVADVVVNDLYTDLHPRENHWYGVEHAILSPHFETATPREPLGDAVERVLVTFGGTDPQNLTEKALDALGLAGYAGDVTVIMGPGNPRGAPDLDARKLRGRVLRNVENMASTCREHDLALTSAGRTVTELMTLGVPTVAMCQNVRELRHTHASGPYGVINLGLGEHVGADALSRHVRAVIDDPGLRRDMRERALRAVAGRSNRAVARRILDAATKGEGSG